MNCDGSLGSFFPHSAVPLRFELLSQTLEACADFRIVSGFQTCIDTVERCALDPAIDKQDKAALFPGTLDCFRPDIARALPVCSRGNNREMRCECLLRGVLRRRTDVAQGVHFIARTDAPARIGVEWPDRWGQSPFRIAARVEIRIAFNSRRAPEFARNAAFEIAQRIQGLRLDFTEVAGIRQAGRPGNYAREGEGVEDKVHQFPSLRGIGFRQSR